MIAHALIARVGEVAPARSVWSQARERLLCGAYVGVVVSGSTWDQVGCDLRLSGFEIRDVILWLGGATVILARAPAAATVAETVLRTGVGALNLGGLRTPFISDEDREQSRQNGLGPIERHKGHKMIFEGGKRSAGFSDTFDPRGRWPANLVRKTGNAGFPGETDLSNPARYFPEAADLPALMSWLIRLMTTDGATMVEPMQDETVRAFIRAEGRIVA